jgi:hypothetical protein
VTVKQVAQVTRNFTEAGIMVHAYLMYGYPTQTVQETIDSLEMVRQMFELGILQSGFWHQFAMTAHSPVGMIPSAFGVIPEMKDITFANNDIQFKDITGINHDKFSFGLKKSLFNFMHGICFDYDLQDWFDFKIPNTTIPSDYIVSCLENENTFAMKPSAKIIWIGGMPITQTITKSKKGNTWEMMRLTFHDKRETIEISLESAKANWLVKALDLLSVTNDKTITYAQLKTDFENVFEDFELFWYSKPIKTLREYGLLVI